MTLARQGPNGVNHLINLNLSKVVLRSTKAQKCISFDSLLFTSISELFAAIRYSREFLAGPRERYMQQLPIPPAPPHAQHK
jgi:hypothetical protein